MCLDSQSGVSKFLGLLVICFFRRVCSPVVDMNIVQFGGGRQWHFVEVFVLWRWFLRAPCFVCGPIICVQFWHICIMRGWTMTCFGGLLLNGTLRLKCFCNI